MGVVEAVDLIKEEVEDTRTSSLLNLLDTQKINYNYEKPLAWTLVTNVRPSPAHYKEGWSR